MIKVRVQTKTDGIECQRNNYCYASIMTMDYREVFRGPFFKISERDACYKGAVSHCKTMGWRIVV